MLSREYQSYLVRRDELANKILKQWLDNGATKCNCGGPQYGTEHAPDCDIELAWFDAQNDAAWILHTD